MSSVEIIAAELQLRPAQVRATAELLDEGATIPFIARYRKELTDSLDEVAIAAIRDRLRQLRELEDRRTAILRSLQEQGKLTDELVEQVKAAATMARLEDVYLPYRPRRRTRATVARERGLEPLAQWLLEQEKGDVKARAAEFVRPDAEVPDAEAALAGARDIVAERLSEDADVRTRMRQFFVAQGQVRSRVMAGKENEGQKYRDYFEWDEPAAKIPSHRMLALRRAEKENIISLDIAPPETDALRLLEGLTVRGTHPSAEQVRLAARDGYKRLLKPALETELRLQLKQRADAEAIRVFVENVRQLLLAPPLGQKPVMAIDPGFRTGCKVVCLDAQGQLVAFDTIFPHEPQRQTAQAGATLRFLIGKNAVEAIAIGNGTAGRETEAFVRSLGLPPEISVVMVSESGASVYSASEVAREEFPTYDITVRGGVSIGRRLMDPLAELVKIDPKSIGVGQYQHDVEPSALKRSLDDTVESCVNAVGVELNTASKQLLTYVSGLGPQLAQHIVDYRNANGPFRQRADLRKVARLGEKAFVQAAGFLRIRNADYPLDRSAVHPESYGVVEQMASDLGCSVADLMADESLRAQIDLTRYQTEFIGLPTLKDIMTELAQPGRDPRAAFESVQFSEGIHTLQDLTVGMKLPGVVTNITAFGAFVDVGVHQDGLVHVSHLADRFVRDPNEVVKVQQQVEVTVLEVDVARKRVALSMKADPFATPPPREAAPPRKKNQVVPEKPARDASHPDRKQAAKRPVPKAVPGSKAKPAERPKPAPVPEEESFEAKLAQLRSKFGR